MDCVESTRMSAFREPERLAQRYVNRIFILYYHVASSICERARDLSWALREPRILTPEKQVPVPEQPKHIVQRYVTFLHRLA
jgi:hypothetical protein